MKILESWKKFVAFIEGKNLPALITVGVFQIIGMITIGILFFWGTNFYEKWESRTTREKIFSKLANAAAYDEKIIGIKMFELSSVINLVESNDAKRTIPEVPEHAIIQTERKKVVFFWRAMPKFFPDVEFGAHKIRCVQGRVRKKLSAISFDKFEDKFLVLYDNSVPEESDEAFKARLGLLNESEKNREERVRGLKNEWIKSHSALFSGNCVETFQGWVIRELD